MIPSSDTSGSSYLPLGGAVAFCGSRHGSPFPVSPIVAAVLSSGGSTRVGCAPGVDAAVRSCCPSAVVFWASSFSGSPRTRAVVAGASALWYLEDWIEGPLKGSVAPKTYADYSWICRKHLIPKIGRIKLAKLAAEDLDRLYARKSAAGQGARTVGYIHSTIRVVLQRAVKKRLIPYNVARDAEPPPRGPKKERPTLSIE